MCDMRRINTNLLPRGMKKTLDWNKNAEVVTHRSKKYTYILYLTRFQGDRDKLWMLPNEKYDELAKECEGTYHSPETWIAYHDDIQSDYPPYACGEVIR